MSYIENILEERGLLGEISKADLEEYNSLIMQVDTSIDINSVILSEENKSKLKEFLNEQDNRERLIKYNLYPMNRLLFYGASGTGKTFLTKALSNYMGYTMLYIDIAKSLSDNTVALNISNIFKLASILKNCIIFLDEADSIAWNRDSNNTDSGTIRRATNSLFQHLDQMDSSNVFISATNMLHRLDLAFERRFDMKFEFRQPDNVETAIIKFLHKEFILKEDISKDKKDIILRRVQDSIKLSYYEIQCIVERAMKKAILNNTLEVKASDIYNDLARTERIRIYID